MTNNLDRIESNLRALFEEKLFKMFSGNQPATNLIPNLVQALRRNLKAQPNGSITAPDQIQIQVAENDLEDWLIQKDTLDNIASQVQNIFIDEGFSFRKPLNISVQENQNIAQHHHQISSFFSEEENILPGTAVMEIVKRNEKAIQLPKNARLIIGGKTNFPLNKPVIDIGRHSDCALILEDLHVSRHHAQIRMINSRFVIFDTGSTAGVFLNGKKVSQTSLQSGDVVRIGLVNLIYVQDTTAANPTTALPVDVDEQNSINGDQK